MMGRKHKNRKGAAHRAASITRPDDAWMALCGMIERDELDDAQVVSLFATSRSGEESEIALPLQAREVLTAMRGMTPEEIDEIEFSLFADEAEWVPAQVADPADKSAA